MDGVEGLDDSFAASAPPRSLRHSALVPPFFFFFIIFSKYLFHMYYFFDGTCGKEEELVGELEEPSLSLHSLFLPPLFSVRCFDKWIDLNYIRILRLSLIECCGPF